MPVPFKEFQPLYPPHPAMTWNPREIHPLKDYIAQYKYDDWHVLVYYFPDGKVQLFSRKKHVLPMYRPPCSLMSELKKLDLPRGQFHVLDGGLMHYRTSRVRNTIVLWDILVHENEYLVGKSYRERYELLCKITGNPSEEVALDGLSIGLRISPHLWLAPTLRGDFKELFKRAKELPELEGLVLKKWKAPLERAYRMESNARWQIRVRKPRQDYAF